MLWGAVEAIRKQNIIFVFLCDHLIVTEILEIPKAASRPRNGETLTFDEEVRLRDSRIEFHIHIEVVNGQMAVFTD